MRGEQELPGQRTWRLFVSYTGEDLSAHAQRVADVARRQQRWIVDDHIDWPATGRPSVAECVAQVRRSDALLLLVAARRGWVPEISDGGDGMRSICHIEWDSAEDGPRVGLVGAESDAWPDHDNPELRSLILGTAGAGAPANLFDPDPASIDYIAERTLDALHQQVTERYTAAQRAMAAAGALKPPYRPLGEIRNDYAMLRAEYGVVPFLHRRSELYEDVAWCESPRRVDVLVRHGSGGVGKTRLAAELCERMGRKGWVAGFLRSGLIESLDQGALLGAGAPVLVVIDYAEARITQAAELIDRLSEVSHPTAIRVLLLARRIGDWYQQLAMSSAQTQELLGGDALTREVAPAVLDVDLRNRFFLAAAEEFGRRLELPTLDTSPVLTDEAFANPLLVSIAALTALREGGAAVHGATAAPEPTQQALLGQLLIREERRWDDGAPAIPGVEGGDRRQLLRRAVAVATVVPMEAGTTEQVASHYLSAVPELPEAHTRAVARWLHNLHPGDDWWNPLEPDLIGEALVTDVLENAPELADVLIEHHGEVVAERLLTVMARAFQHRPEAAGIVTGLLGRHLSALAAAAMKVAVATGPPVGRALRAALAMPENEDEAVLLHDRFPSASFELAQAAALAAESAVRAFRVEADGNPGRAGKLASSLVWRSNRLSDLGRREDALIAIEEAVTIYRTLAEAHPDAFLPDLATSLNNLSNSLSDLGRREDALTAIDEAVTIRRTLADARPDAFTPDLATSLNNLSGTLSDNGRREDALTAIEEATDLYRTLADARPDAFTPHLATSLNNLSVQLSNLGRREDALTAIDEAVTIRRTLADARPDAFTPDLASSLNNLSLRLSDMGRREDALTAIDEAVTIRRTLAHARPHAFTPDLAMSLNNLSVQLSNLGRREDALTAIEEAVSMFRTLADARPDAFLPDLARSLAVLSQTLLGLNRVEEAVETSTDAVQTIAPFVAALPSGYGPLTRVITDVYRQACEATETEPDMGLLGTIAASLDELGDTTAS